MIPRFSFTSRWCLAALLVSSVLDARVALGQGSPAVRRPAAAPLRPGITVTSPQAGATWNIGTTQTIAWTSVGLPPTPVVKIVLLRNGNFVATLAASAPLGGANGSFQWQVPKLPEANGYTIRVTSALNDAFRGESYPFSLASAAPTLTVTAPAAGARWTEGSRQTISWNHTGNIGPWVNITLFQGGAAVALVASGVTVPPGGGGSFSWVVKKVPASGAEYTVRIVAAPPIGAQLQASSPPFVVVNR